VTVYVKDTSCLLVFLSCVSKLDVPVVPSVVSCASIGTVEEVFIVNIIIHLILQYSLKLIRKQSVSGQGLSLI
jgi:hypothetical protein